MIIGLSGYIGSGKDTVGKIIQYLTNKRLSEYDFDTFLEELGGERFYGEILSDWQIKKFAGKLKEIASILTGIPVEKFEDQEFKKSYLPTEWNKKVQRNNMKLSRDNRFDDFDVWEEEESMIVREFLQKLGTDALRNNLHPQVWVNALFADYKRKYDIVSQHYNANGTRTTAICPEDDNWIISDVRFENEAAAIKERGGIIVRINRDVYMETKSGVVRAQHNPDFDNYHFSETALDKYKFDWFIDNNSDITALKEAVRVFLTHYKLI